MKSPRFSRFYPFKDCQKPFRERIERDLFVILPLINVFFNNSVNKTFGPFRKPLAPRGNTGGNRGGSIDFLEATAGMRIPAKRKAAVELKAALVSAEAWVAHARAHTKAKAEAAAVKHAAGNKSEAGS